MQQLNISLTPLQGTFGIAAHDFVKLSPELQIWPSLTWDPHNDSWVLARWQSKVASILTPPTDSVRVEIVGWVHAVARKVD